MIFWPATLQIYFCLSAILGFIQSKIMRSPFFRGKMGMMPMPTKIKPELPGGGVNAILTPAEVEARKAKSNASVLDKGISNITGGFKKMGEGIQEKMLEQGYSVGGKKGAAGSKAARRTKQEIRSAAQYEDKRRREIEMERDSRRKKGRKQS